MLTYTKDTLPWRIRYKPKTESGALTEQQVANLSDAFEINIEAVQFMSQQLDIALSKDLHLAQPDLLALKREKGIREAASAIKTVEKAERLLESALAIVSELKFKDPFAYIGRPNFSLSHLKNFQKAACTVREFREFLETAANQQLVTYAQMPNNRKLRDERRTIVCTAIFNCWLDAERNLTVTTDPVTFQRTGALIKFANEVVSYVTEPASALSGETIKQELADFQRLSPSLS